MEDTNGSESKIRLNIKKNFKGEKGYEYTVRGDNIEEIAILKEQVKKVKDEMFSGEREPYSGDPESRRGRCIW